MTYFAAVNSSILPSLQKTHSSHGFLPLLDISLKIAVAVVLLFVLVSAAVVLYRRPLFRIKKFLAGVWLLFFAKGSCRCSISSSIRALKLPNVKRYSSCLCLGLSCYAIGGRFR